MKVALYLRVANDDQNKALPTQELYLRDWANKQGYEVTSVFYDMTSGTSLDRPGLQTLLCEVDSKQFDAVLVKGAERLIRNLCFVPQLADTFRRAGVRVISPVGPNDVFGTAPWMLTALNADWSKRFCNKSTPKQAAAE